MFKNLIKELANIEEVESIALGGSRGSNNHDQYSDYDVYVYLNKELSSKRRSEILNKYCKYIEIANMFWEEEDDGILNNGIDIELIYRDINWLNENLNNTLIKCNPSMGYTTCFWDNLLNSKTLFDRNNKLTELREKYNINYPDELKYNIIYTNSKLIKDHMPSLYYQIEKAVKRNDLISVNHRVTEFLALYFNIIYAINETPHKGEKRMLELTKNLSILPKDYELLINEVFRFIYQDNKKLLSVLDLISINLYNLLKDHNYDVSFESYLNK